MKKSTRHILAGLIGVASMAFVSCSSTSKNNDYATYPSSGYGNYGDNSGGYGATQSVADTGSNTSTGAGAGGAYPTTPQNNYGSDYGTSGGGATTPTTSSGQTHTVQRGENLFRISQSYGTTVSNIKAANGLTTDLIRPGDVLVVR